MCNTILVTDLARSTELAGAADGEAWFQAARQRLDTEEAGLLALDFNDVRLATVSWLREGPLALRTYASAMRPDIVIFAGNLSDFVREELEVALEATGNVMIAADISPDFDVHRPTVMGHLDPALHDTLRVVQGQSEFDALFVSRALPHVGLSAASNRLAALEVKGILKSERRGRARVYSPLLEDLQYGN
jgi:DNA-binding transcriptional ArsR family regulator